MQDFGSSVYADVFRTRSSAEVRQPEPYRAYATQKSTSRIQVCSTTELAANTQLVASKSVNNSVLGSSQGQSQVIETAPFATQLANYQAADSKRAIDYYSRARMQMARVDQDVASELRTLNVSLKRMFNCDFAYYVSESQVPVPSGQLASYLYYVYACAANMKDCDLKSKALQEAETLRVQEMKDRLKKKAAQPEGSPEKDSDGHSDGAEQQ